MTDKELEQIYNEAYKAVYWTAMSLLKNEADAEDVVQDTFVSFIESYSDLTDTSKATALLKKIAANKSLNRIKLAKTDVAEDEFFDNVEAVPEDFLPDSIVESDEARKIVMDIINNYLSEDVRRTLILFYFDDMSTKEIAEVLGIPQGTVLRRLNFARNKIKKEVEKYEKDNDTKLFGMAIPFLTKLFIKESEQVAFKPMPASLANLSASAEAPSQGAGIRASKEAAKKGTEIMKTKIIIGSIAAVVAVGIIVGVLVAVLGKKKDTKPERRTTRSAASEIDEDEEFENDVENADEDAAPEITKEPDEVITYYLLDVNDKDALRKLINGAIECEPRKGECNDDVMDKLNVCFTPTVDRYGWYGENCQLYFKYDPCNSGEYENTDHVLYIGYSGYETEDIEGEDYILSYEKVYAHEARPGIATIWIEVYDKDRAVTCWNNARDILANEVFPDAVLDTSWEDRYQLMYGEGDFDWYAMLTCKQINDSDLWVVCLEITLDSPELMVEET
ncbi:MAG: sigma-70 family RNA polymerase sigma factor [Clostridiales bacterium]|nr:sigma-70 family RNA polymerase sigma factor [Clostridiales bacterium]